jgi:energy-coupling factor transporter ATP-binding protein EcfA2
MVINTQSPGYFICDYFTGITFNTGDGAMIHFSKVSLIYPNSQRTIIEDSSFSVNEGEFVLLMGHTGAGKSSILKLINGLVPHHTGGILSGEIIVAGKSTSSTKPGELADVVGIVGQNPINTFVSDTVEEEIAFTLETLGISPEVMRKRVEEVLDLLALTPLRRRNISQLSGGEQQRVAIAAALVTNPKVLLLDEPTSALDPIAAEEVLSILHRLVHDLGLTIVLSEHRLERVIQFVDRIILIHGDGTLELGSSEEIMQTSPIAPPLVELARALQMPTTPLSIREFRKHAPKFEVSPAKPDLPTNPLGEIALSINELSAAYQDSNKTYALSNINLEIRTGEIVALMGRNGAGKTTLLKCAVGLAPIISGQAKVMNQDPAKLAGPELIKYVGYVPQEPTDLLYGQTVAEECLLADTDNQVDSGSTLAIYESLMQIPNLLAHPRDISEGQRLGLALSIILSAHPKLIVLDEPTRGLDYAAKKTLVEILKRISHQDNRAIFISTHDVELVAEVADRVVFLADGEVIADGSTSQVLTSSPAFAPQVSKALPNTNWITVSEVERYVGRAK